MVIHQLLPVAKRRDAIGNHALGIRRVLREAGVRSDIFSPDIHPDMRGDATPLRRFTDDDPRAVILYHASTGSGVVDWLRARRCRIAIDYHNITPAEHFAPWEPQVAHTCALGRRQLAELARRTELALADSAYNETELIELGYRRTAVVPILVDPSTFERRRDPATVDRLGALRAAGGTDWLFVGRIAPNKAQHDIIKAFACYRRTYDPAARLWLVGGTSSHAYETALRAFVADLGLGDAVHLTGEVPDEVLSAHYASADVFVCLSDHEGFGVPLLEAMHHDLPVVAYAAAAVPETLGGAGLLLGDKRPSTVAAAVHLVQSDPELRAGLVEAGRRRLAELDPDRTARRLLDALASLTGERSG